MEMKQRMQARKRDNPLSHSKVLCLFLWIAVGCLFSTVWNVGNILSDYQGKILILDSPLESVGSNANGDDVGKMKRYWKYSQIYRYIPPASRYDYIPVPAKECGDSPNFDPWWTLDHMDRSRLHEDKFVYETFFKDQASDFIGTYVELGAFNGRQESNTRFFDLCLGWKGLLIEGNPENYEKTIFNRPHAHKMSLAPSCSAEYEAVNKTVEFFRYPMTNVGLVDHAKSYAGKPTVDVPCGPLSPILEDVFAEDHDNSSGTALPTLDFFSLDVEGAEALVLSTIDFHAIRINILMVEIHNNHCKTNKCKVRMEVRAKMDAEGYKRYEGLVHASDIYVHPESPFQIPESIAIIPK